MNMEEGKAGRYSGEVWGRIKRDMKAYWGFVLLFAIYSVTVRKLFHAFCPSVILAGLPCPGCGMTRSVTAFLMGEFERGIRMNPLGIVWILWGVCFAVMRYGFGKKSKGLMTAAGVIVVLMIVVYAWRMYQYFPGEPPISYTPGSILEQMVPGYRGMVMGVWENIRGMWE